MKRKYLILFSLSGFILCLDQFTKYLAQTRLQNAEAQALIPGLVNIALSRAQGFAFGLLREAPASLQQVFFLGIPVFALILIVLIFIKLQDDQMLTSVALTCILGGAIGNLVDRMSVGYVIDFLQFRGFLSGLPSFNLADIAIVVGVTLMFFSTLVQGRKAVRVNP